MDVLISGASVAGPVTAYWLQRHGHRVTVVEKAPSPRRTGGHAVDLFAPAMDIVERMGLLDQVLAHRTGTERITMLRTGARRPITVDAERLLGAISRRHVEIMRDDLSELLYDATAADVEYVFDDRITAISADGDVTFDRGAPRRFDIVIGADGLHSGVRGLVFGPESDFATWIGGYIAVATVPNHLGLHDEMRAMLGPRRMVGLYGAGGKTEARAFFLFRPPAELSYHHRDVARQKQLLRAEFGSMDGEVPRLLAATDAADAFYFDAITQLRMDSWTSGRVALVGDAGYCPGPAVGGSTSLAVVGAYVLAGELAAAGGDPAVAFPAYEAAMADYVRSSRTFALRTARSIVPGSRAAAWALVTGARVVAALPNSLVRGVVRRAGGSFGMHDTVAVREYPELTLPAT